MLLLLMLPPSFRTTLLTAAVATLALAQTSPAPVGIFESHGDVGISPIAGTVEFNAAKGEYRITGSGANVWTNADAFQFAWKKVTGDVTLTADIQFEGTSKMAHRKAMLMIRQALTPDAAYADATLHGEGSGGLQFRATSGGLSTEIQHGVKGPTRLSIRRRGNVFTIAVGTPGGEMKEIGPQTVELSGPVYVGLGVCSHDVKATETAVFSNVSIKQP